MVTQTSINAYLDVLPDLGRRQKEVFEAIKRLYTCSNAEISRFLGWAINRVTPRTYELRKKGVIYRCGIRQCKITGNNVNVWRAR